jgi:hypothetical protein
MSDRPPPPAHLVPDDELRDHTLSEHCSCKPFVYARLVGATITSYEIRHNSFNALPVDEEALERAQQDAIVDAPASATVEPPPFNH